MNREIKFRAWDSHEKHMYTVTELSFMKYDSKPIRNGCEGFWGDNHRKKFALDELNIMQYTGLKDKNGKEIYEGDIVIVNIPTPHGTYPADHDQNMGIVEWDSEGADYNIMKNSECLLGLGFTGATYEILGNIYESSELLK